ncbi:MAG: MarR family winged helix-turn-helix transcriptional regulator [Candidatus Saccharimonadales bacterium]
MTNNFAQDLDNLDAAMTRFRRAMSRAQAWQNILAIAKVSIDMAGCQLLYYLAQAPKSGCPVKDLARRLGVEMPSVSRKLQQLEQAGLVTHLTDAHDRRVHIVELTPSGRRVLARIQAAKRKIITDILQSWPDSERQQFIKSFQRFAEAMAEYHQSDRSQAKATKTASGAHV